MAFKGMPKDGQECCHNDGDALNDSVANLRWDTHLENCRDRKKHGNYLEGEDHFMSKITNKQAMEIYNSNLGLAELSRKYGIHKTKIWSIKTGETWSSVTGHNENIWKKR